MQQKKILTVPFYIFLRPFTAVRFVSTHVFRADVESFVEGVRRFVHFDELCFFGLKQFTFASVNSTARSKCPVNLIRIESER